MQHLYQSNYLNISRKFFFFLGALSVFIGFFGDLYAIGTDSTKSAIFSDVATSNNLNLLRLKRMRQFNNVGVDFGVKRSWQNAANLFVKAQQQDPHNDTITYNLSLTQGFLKNYQTALDLQAKTGSGRRYLQNKGTYHALMGDLDQGLSIWSKAFPTDTLCFNVAVAYYKQNKLDDSMDWARRVGFSKNGLFHELHANLAFKQGKYKEAEKLYQKSEKILPNLRLTVQLAQAYLAQHEYEKAQTLFEEYLSSRHTLHRFEARLGLGHVFYRLRNYQRAVFEYDAACRIGDASFEAWTALGNAYLGTQGNRQAQKAFERAISFNRNYKPAWLGLAVVFYRTKNYSEALCCFSESDSLINPRDRNHADLFAIKGFCLMYSNQVKQAKPAIDQAMRLQGKGLLPCLALSEYLRLEQYFLVSLKWLEKAIKANQEASAKMLVNRGNLYLKCKAYDEALDDFTDAHAKDFGNVNACNGLAISWLNLDEMDKAKALYDSLLKRKSMAMLHNNRGIVESYLAMRDRKDRNLEGMDKHLYLSMQNFEKGLQVDTTKKAYHVNMGNVSKAQQKELDAIDHYQKHLSKNAINNLGILFTKGVRKDYSTHYLNTAVDLDSANNIYLYNRAKSYREFFRDEFLRRPDFQRAFKLAPTNDIGLKYSPDGYITIFLYDYEFENYEFPGEPLMDVHTTPIDDFTFLISPDFMTLKGEGAILPQSASSSYLVTNKPNRYREASKRSRGKTSCPDI
jgi:tetratricopeptide (TPR) repeat protein